MKNKQHFYLLAGITLLSSTSLLAPNAQAQATPNDQVLSYVDEMPAFEGGDPAMHEFISSNLQYPQEAVQAGVEGVVIVALVVETDGSVSDVELVKSHSKTMDAEASRVASLTTGKWKTGKLKGKPVRVKTLIPIKFDLDEAGNPVVLHRKPQFKGGQEAMVSTLYQHVQLPEAALQQNLAAQLYVKFTVEKDGSIANISIADTKLAKVVAAGRLNYMDASGFEPHDKALLAQLSEAAAKAVKATDGMWHPALQHGKPVAAEVTVPLRFPAPTESASSSSLLNAYKAEVAATEAMYNTDEVDVAPELKNETFRKFLAQNIRYPNTSFEGTVRVAFIITKDGKAIGPMTDVQDTQKEVAAEISRVFALMQGQWAPAQKASEPVTTMQEITIAFTKGKHAPAPSADVVVKR